LLSLFFDPEDGGDIFLWGSSSVMKSVFLAQKRVIRVLLRLGSRDSCREGFKRLGILTVPSLYIYSMLMFVVRNRKLYLTNSNIHHINTRQAGMLHVSSVRLSSAKRGVLYSSIMVFNKLPQNLQKMSDNVKIFKSTLRSYLAASTFYSLDEYISASVESK
jgi:hypothetical protein